MLFSSKSQIVIFKKYPLLIIVDYHIRYIKQFVYKKGLERTKID